MDLRIQKTYRSLLAAFTRLLETHRYEEITVAMLCDEAMIRRTTFYKHFADKSEFFGFFMDSLRTELTSYDERKARELEHASVEDQGRANLESLVQFMIDHEKLVDNIFESAMSGMMILMLEERVAETIRERYRPQFASDEESATMLAASSQFAAGGIVCLLEKWWAHGHSRESEMGFISMVETLVARIFAA